VRLHLRGGDLLERPLRRLAVVHVHAVRVGRDDEAVHPEPAGEECRDTVLVDDRLDAPEAVRRSDDRNASAARRHDQDTVVEQRTDDRLLDHLNRIGRRHDAPIAPRRVLDHLPPVQTRPLLGVAARVERADRLGRVPHGRVVGRHDHLREHRCHLHPKARGLQCVVERLLQQVADLALGRRVAHVQRLTVHLVRRALRAQQRGADLRAVPVRDHQADPVLDEPDDCGSRPAGVGQLLGNRPLLAGADQRVASDGD
jgi:hypothetical protein